MQVTTGAGSVSYTHLDVYKRQAEQPAAASPWHVETGDAEVPTPAHWWRARLDDAPGADWPAQQQALCMLAAAVREADPARPHAAQGGAAV